MKAEILKIAGVKNEKEFYKKFPTKEAFMKVYSKEFKKAKLGKVIPNAQTGKNKRIYGCKGQSCTQTGEGIQKVGSRLGLDNAPVSGGVDPSFVDYAALNAPLSWEELQKFNDINPKSKEFKTYFKDLKNKYPNLTVEQLLAAGADSARINLRKQNLERYDQPSEQTYDKAYHPFYRFLMNQPQRVTIPQVLEAQPGGYSGFEQNVRSNYGKKKGKEGSQVKKLKQLTSYEGDIDGMMPKAQPGLTMPQPTNIMTNVNPFWAQSQFGAPAPQGGMLNPTPPPPMYDVNQTGTFAQQVGASANAIGPSKGLGGTDFLGKVGGVAGIFGIATDIAGGLRDLEQQRIEEKQWEQQNRVSDVAARASQVRPEPINRKYTRPEDVVIQPEQLFPTYGTGYNAAFAARNGSVVKAEGGMQIGGNLTEIQNMYNPGDLYSDLGFEPLNDSSKVKQYYGGGYIPQAQVGQSILQNVGGFAKQMGKQYGTNSFKTFLGSPAGANIATQLGSYLGNPITRMQSAGSKIGGAAGKALGTATFGPVGGWVGSLAGNLIGGALDKSQERIAANQERVRKNINIMTGQDFARGMQGQFGSYMEHGGWVSHDWQPQVITHFGEHSMKSLLKPDPTMDTLRSGGHIRQNNMSPMDQYAMGGELQTTWGGYAKPMTYNHHLPGSGEITMFHGATHENGGIGVKYGNDGEYDPYTEYGKDGIESKTDVEVETREPAVQLPDTSSKNPQSKFALGGEDSDKNMSLNVYGNLTVDKDLYPDNPFIAKFHGKTYKKAVKDIALLTEKENKKIAKAQNELASLLQSGVISSYDKLKLKSLELAMTGPDMKLKSFANAIQDLAIGQNATNETAEESGLDAKALSERKIKIDKEAMKEQAKWGKAIKKAQNGITDPEDKRKYDEIMGLYEKAKKAGKRSQVAKQLQQKFHEYYPDIAKEIILANPNVTATGKRMGYRTIEDLKNAPMEDILGSNVDEYFGPRTEQYIASLKNRQPKSKLTLKPAPPIPLTPPPTSTTYARGYTPQKQQFPWAAAANTLLPYLERPFQDEYVDLSPEMLALATNQLEPVPAQLFQPQLKTPYSVSLQDQLNEVTAQTRAAERMAGNNPAAMAAISAQANRAKSQILGEQMRINQGLMDKTIGSNIDALNKAKLLNLEILAEQAGLRSLAESNTKETLRRAVGSMADKIQKSRLENRSLAVLQQAFPNYRLTGDMRFTPRGFTTFDTTVPGAFGMLPTTAVSRTTAPAQPTVAQQIMQSTMPKNYVMAVQPAYQEPTPQELVEGIIGYSSPQPPSRAEVLPPYGTSRKNGGKTKKDSRNSNIVRAMKNL